MKQTLQAIKLPEGARESLAIHTDDKGNNILTYAIDTLQGDGALKEHVTVRGFKAIGAPRRVSAKYVGRVETDKSGKYLVHCPNPNDVERIYARYLECKRADVMSPVLAFVDVKDL